MVWCFTLRRITSLVILLCILVALFATIFSHFHGLKMQLFTSDGTSLGNVQPEESLTVESVTYGAKYINGDHMKMELLEPSPPDLYPTPRRSRRGTSDNTFGTLHCL